MYRLKNEIKHCKKISRFNLAIAILTLKIEYFVAEYSERLYV